MKREDETLAYWKRVGEDAQKHSETLEKEVQHLKELYAKAEKMVDFYRQQCLKFYEPKRR